MFYLAADLVQSACNNSRFLREILLAFISCSYVCIVLHLRQVFIWGINFIETHKLSVSGYTTIA